jgi:hypothetical protein
MWQRGSLVFAVLLVAVGGGCSGEPAGPFRVGAAPAAQPVKLAEPRADGLVMMAQWPKACELLAEADARAIIPTSTKATFAPEAVTYLDASQFGGPGGKSEMPDGGCEASIYFPETSMQEDDPGATVKVVIRGFGAPKHLKEQFKEKFADRKKEYACPADLVKRAKLTDCVHEVTGYEVLKNGAWFDVGSVFFGLDEGVTIEGQPEGTNANVYWEEQVMPRFVEAVAHHLP